MDIHRTLAILGPGRVGTAVATLANKAGYEVVAIGGRNVAAAKQAASLVSPKTRGCELREAACSSDFVLLTVTDDAIAKVCKQLTDSKAFRPKSIIAHCSGALSSRILAPASVNLQCSVASFHPLQTFPTVEAAISSLSKARWFCEGDEYALAQGFHLIRSIGGTAYQLRPDAKALYHAAAVMACNYLVALVDASLHVGKAASIDRDELWSSMIPLVEATLCNITNLGTAHALTGPIARGDSSTINHHIKAIQQSCPDLLNIYLSLGRWTVDLARQKGLAPPSLLDEISEILSDAATGNGGSHINSDDEGKIQK